MRRIYTLPAAYPVTVPLPARLPGDPPIRLHMGFGYTRNDGVACYSSVLMSVPAWAANLRAARTRAARAAGGGYDVVGGFGLRGGGCL